MKNRIRFILGITLAVALTYMISQKNQSEATIEPTPSPAVVVEPAAAPEGRQVVLDNATVTVEPASEPAPVQVASLTKPAQRPAESIRQVETAGKAGTCAGGCACVLEQPTAHGGGTAAMESACANGNCGGRERLLGRFRGRRGR